eukprot:TRINITY_DN4820_c0_g1_i1.p1 TRINITY_DN4820_c0_g1~~TRINITY_DN4820_c0_g1_i1.p1  ORF type:complete len:577 (-),score=80.70 TRINITY_DN4820_c0_g1_i1:160-1890(-)
MFWALGIIFLYTICPSNGWSYTCAVIADLENTLYEAMDEGDQKSNGVGGSIVVGVLDDHMQGLKRRGLVRFNISDLWSQVNSFADVEHTTMVATIEMTVRTTGQNPSMIQVYPVTTSWGAGISNASHQPNQGVPSEKGDASWLNNFYPDHRWNVSGGDYLDTLLAQTEVKWYQTYKWSSSDLLVQVLNVAQHPEDNYGFLFRSADESVTGTTKEFFGASSSITDETVKPRLLLTFEARAPIWLWALVGVGALVAVILVGVGLYVFRNRRVTFTYHSVRDYDHIAREETDIEQLFSDPSIRIIQLSQIKLGKIIGTGASGAVFSAFLPNNRPVAVKKINISVGQGEVDLRSFIDEIKIMSAVAHPNLLSLIAIALSEDLTDVVLITNLIDGGSLGDLLFKRHKKFKMHQKLDIVSQIAYGMHYLHSLRPRIIHRDLKPDNILITKQGVVKIADFGMSKMIQNQTKTMTTSGTPHYMAPEIIAKGKFSEKTDVYSFGIILWEIYVEKRPYEGVGHAFQVMYKVVAENLRPEVPSDCPPQWAGLIISCVSTKPSERPSFKRIITELKNMDGPEYLEQNH